MVSPPAQHLHNTHTTGTKSLYVQKGGNGKHSVAIRRPQQTQWIHTMQLPKGYVLKQTQYYNDVPQNTYNFFQFSY